MSRLTRARLTDLLARAAIVVLFGGLSASIWAEFQRTGHLTGLFLLASELLVVVLTIVRRPAQFIDRSPAALVVTLLSVYGPPLLRADDAWQPLAPDLLTALVSATALALVVYGKCTLGRSFGLIPANRGVVVKGPYALVRHPIYSGYLVAHLAFLFAHPSAWNLALLAVADSALIIRALYEERVLLADVRYREYCQRVNWHLVPGVF